MECKKVAALVLAGAMAVTTMQDVGSAGGSAKYPGKDILYHSESSKVDGTDTAARGLMQYMKENLDGANFVATNKPDGGGVTGMVETSAAKADGYTLGMVTVELAMFPWQDKMPGNTGRLCSNLCTDRSTGSTDRTSGCTI